MIRLELDLEIYWIYYLVNNDIILACKNDLWILDEKNTLYLLDENTLHLPCPNNEI